MKDHAAEREDKQKTKRERRQDHDRARPARDFMEKGERKRVMKTQIRKGCPFRPYQAAQPAPAAIKGARSSGPQIARFWGHRLWIKGHWCPKGGSHRHRKDHAATLSETEANGIALTQAAHSCARPARRLRHQSGAQAIRGPSNQERRSGKQARPFVSPRMVR